MRFLTVFSIILLLQAAPVLQAAPIETYTFESPEQEETFYKLSDELRCLVCQNQNIAESNADLAKDLRREIYNMINEGQSEEQIIDFMVQRYGDYVLYRPPMKPLTWLLWFGPAIVFLFGVYYAIKRFRSLSTDVPQSDLSEQDIERIKRLHAEQKENR
jgi:cytochrome c-type biogenesis protein CcmH